MQKERCLNCNKKYLPTRRGQKFCKTSCRVSYSRKSNQGYEQKVIINPIQILNEDTNLLVGFVSPKPDMYDCLPKEINDLNDEPKQWAEPKKEKTMPAGLSKTQQLRFIRENKSKK